MITEVVFSAGQVSQLLQVARPTVNRLARWELLETFKRDRYHFVTRAALVKFTDTHPQYFGGLPYENLVSLLGDKQLAAKFAAQPRRLLNGKPVRHVESGKIYPSGRKAAEAHFVSPDSVCYCCRGYNATTSAGRFEYVYPD